MTSRDFCYWLQGYFELTEERMTGPGLSLEQTGTIRRHLALVFEHEIDPSAGPPEHQKELNEIHGRPVIGGVDPVSGAVFRC